MLISYLGLAVLIASHMVAGHAVHRWLYGHGVPLPTDAGAWAGLAFAVFALVK